MPTNQYPQAVFVQLLLYERGAGCERIAAWCRERLAAIKVPRYVAFADSLSHTPTHRAAKFKLQVDATLRSRATDLEA